MRKLVLIVVLLAGCKQVPTLPGLTPYKIDIQQGNYVTQEMVAKLKPGMTRSQVRFVLGTPLVVDPFRTDRWDYAYVFKKHGTVTEQRRITVIFRDDKLARIEGDVVPAGAGKAESGAAAVKPGSELAPPKAGGTTPRPAEAQSAPGAPSATAPAASTPAPSGETPKADTPKAGQPGS